MKPTLVLGAMATLIGLAGCGAQAVNNGSGGVGGQDNSSVLAQSIETDGASQLQSNVASVDASATVSVNSADCTETGTTQAYTCLVIYNVSDVAAGLDQDYLLTADGSCDDQGNCQWHSTGPGVPTSQ